MDFGPALQCQVVLKNQDLWKKFHVHETEMIISKTGSRMFPSLQLEIKGLSPNNIYRVVLEMEPVCRNRFKYSASGGWLPSGSEEAISTERFYIHPDSPARGEFWMGQTLSFDRVKLTNTFAPLLGQVVLSSMHKYQPKIIITQLNDVCEMSWAPKAILRFSETQFIAVTAYQNEKITQLKIKYNPFAKGFRENGQAKYKRKQARAAKIVNVSDDEEEIVVVDSTVASTTNDRLSESSESSTSTISCSTESQPRVETSANQDDSACDILSRPVATSTPYPVVTPFVYRPVVHPRPMYRYKFTEEEEEIVVVDSTVASTTNDRLSESSQSSTSTVSCLTESQPRVETCTDQDDSACDILARPVATSTPYPVVAPFVYRPVVDPRIQVPLNIISPSTSASYPSPTYPDPIQPEATYFESSLAESSSQLTPSEYGSSSRYNVSQSDEESQLDLSNQSMEVEVSHSERARTPELRPFGVSQLEASHSATWQPAPSHYRVRQLEENNAAVRQPQRKLTDFSIRAVTG
ncbi:T-box transcription factor TBX6-like [Diabrotica virgifera virgifera]|uniref:T-box domain-containing protein n=1 Tax=Diabrotica virgifera virgifera TaxID=50390 RepID=A0ABM5KCI1_DIAVI|nr:T-box transcription factor TBX6-like [Diabrotica virgifera virgifera]